MPTAPANLDKNKVDFLPAPDEVARKAYFIYVSRGEPSGQEVQHWLAAEAELIAERNHSRIHTFPQRI